ncbi:SusD/RagB family nutrient-binding outer membrane lipoprotein [Fodinibius salsisoli]|uniref:SusD/RagB family nutrient-binding outer membrane lipoprotein n=1 Tax=Fodinibius salsisoli TaxID=2820877 RepID=A0ABT3PL08_9BACT|nr:SusD/RagB family nutrient-binding outer membrane lipoprotein [Fodinibius salsisoli]MCW9706635.1 SusD/RagB family nutrient-binding outer membrane lipoprotein [Fodinibius salsisoli]
MKKQIYCTFVGLLVTVLLVSACSDFNSINTNPNAPTEVTSGMLATNLILDISEQSGTKGFLRDDMLAKYIAWNEKLEGYQYNEFGRDSFGGLLILNNVDQMVSFAPNGEVKKSYQALGHFVRAFKFFRMSMYMGDIPYSEAIQGENEEPIYRPSYDTQKEVILGVLNELDQAEQLFAEGTNFEGDPIYGGDVAQWRKLANSFQLHVLINLHKKTGDADLNVAARFQDIVNNRPIFESNADNFQLTYSDQDGQKYPWYKEGNNFLIYPMVSNLLIENLKQLGDRRLFYYTAPSPVQIDQGRAVSDWDAYKGVDVASEFANITAVASSNDYSNINLRYSERPEGEPTFLLSYGQLNFIMAEAAARGWITGTGENYYNEGIRASMEFVADHTPDDSRFHHNMPITDSYISSYIQSSEVAFATTLESQVKQIVIQKYILFYMQSPWNPYFEYRRTGYPAFPINTNSNLNTPTDQIPNRWMYPSDEFDQNRENVQAALDRQFGGEDDVNGKMWILKD